MRSPVEQLGEARPDLISETFSELTAEIARPRVIGFAIEQRQSKMIDPAVIRIGEKSGDSIPEILSEPFAVFLIKKLNEKTGTLRLLEGRKSPLRRLRYVRPENVSAAAVSEPEQPLRSVPQHLRAESRNRH